MKFLNKFKFSDCKKCVYWWENCWTGYGVKTITGYSKCISKNEKIIKVTNYGYHRILLPNMCIHFRKIL